MNMQGTAKFYPSPLFADAEPPEETIAHPAFERLCRMCRQSPALLPMAVEAMLNMPLAICCDRRADVQVLAADRFGIHPMQFRSAAQGIPEFSYIVFSSLKSWEHSELGGRHAAPAWGFKTQDIFDGLMTDESMHGAQHVVVDPFTPHMLRFESRALGVLLTAWSCTGAAPDPFLSGGDSRFAVCTDVPQLLLDRLLALTTVASAIERLHLLDVRPMQGEKQPFRRTLIVSATDWPVMERLRRALPLLNDGLNDEHRIRHLVFGAVHPPIEAELLRRLPPVYDRRAMGQCA
jgi:hypothetical protein